MTSVYKTEGIIVVKVISESEENSDGKQKYYKKIIVTTMTTAICNIIAFTLCFIASLGVLLAVVWLDEERRKGKF